MAVVLSSGQLAGALNTISEKKSKDGIEQFIALCEPLIKLSAGKYPLYMREDMKQEARIELMKKAENLALEFKSGTVKNLFDFISRVIYNSSADYARTQKKIECKLIRIDDIEIELAVYPKTYEKTKLLMKIRKALEHFYLARYPENGYGERASRFAYIMLAGKRPTLTTNNLQSFFNGNRIHAQQAFSTSLVIIKRLLERHKEEVECVN